MPLGVPVERRVAVVLVVTPIAVQSVGPIVAISAAATHCSTVLSWPGVWSKW